MLGQPKRQSFSTLRACAPGAAFDLLLSHRRRVYLPLLRIDPRIVAAFIAPPAYIPPSSAPQRGRGVDRRDAGGARSGRPPADPSTEFVLPVTPHRAVECGMAWCADRVQTFSSVWGPCLARWAQVIRRDGVALPECCRRNFREFKLGVTLQPRFCLRKHASRQPIWREHGLP